MPRSPAERAAPPRSPQSAALGGKSRPFGEFYKFLPEGDLKPKKPDMSGKIRTHGNPTTGTPGSAAAATSMVNPPTHHQPALPHSASRPHGLTVQENRNPLGQQESLLNAALFAWLPAVTGKHDYPAPRSLSRSCRRSHWAPTRNGLGQWHCRGS